MGWEEDRQQMEEDRRRHEKENRRKLYRQRIAGEYNLRCWPRGAHTYLLAIRFSTLEPSVRLEPIWIYPGKKKGAYIRLFGHRTRNDHVVLGTFHNFREACAKAAEWLPATEAALRLTGELEEEVPF